MIDFKIIIGILVYILTAFSFYKAGQNMATKKCSLKQPVNVQIIQIEKPPVRKYLRLVD